MNEEQADKIIDIMSDISRKFDVIIPRTAYEIKTIKFNEMFKDKVRNELFSTLTYEQKQELFSIEKEIREAIE